MHQWRWEEEAVQGKNEEKEDNVATEYRINERFRQSTVVERDRRNYWNVPQIYGGHLVGSWTLHTPIGGVMLGGNRMLDLATGRIFIYKRRGKLVLHSKGRME